MSGADFGEWMVFLHRESLMPAHEHGRHADMLAALHNGPLQRKDKKLWDTPHFVWGERWTLPPPPPPKLTKEQSRAQLRAFVKAMNASRRRG